MDNGVSLATRLKWLTKLDAIKDAKTYNLITLNEWESEFIESIDNQLFSLLVCLILSRNSLTSFVAISFTFFLSIPYFLDSCSILSSVNVPVKNMAEGLFLISSLILTLHLVVCNIH